VRSAAADGRSERIFDPFSTPYQVAVVADAAELSVSLKELLAR
jgi:hypothetical protein